jgi:hypothetical protein
VDIYSTRVPVILIIVLVGILILQYVTNDQNSSKLIDYETCELYIQELQISTKQFLNEYDSKCLEMKKITSP